MVETPYMASVQGEDMVETPYMASVQGEDMVETPYMASGGVGDGQLIDLPKEAEVSQSGSGGTGCGWFLGMVALVLALMSISLSIGIGADIVTAGEVGVSQEYNGLAGLLLIVGLVALGMARRGRK